MLLTYLLFICGLLISVQGSILPDSRIVGGDSVTIYAYPYNVALLHRNPSNVFDLACGGAILRMDVIVTAAQCLINTSPSDWRVKAGSSYYIGSSGETANVQRYLINQGYVGFPVLANDIALVYLTAALPPKDGIVQILLPAQDSELTPGTSVTMTGWGARTAGGSNSDVLQRVNTAIVDPNICLNSYAGLVTVTNNMLCAGRIGVGGQDFCARDTGGPLVSNNFLVGIASFSYGCGNPNFPGIYTKVSKYRTWINSNM